MFALKTGKASVQTANNAAAGRPAQRPASVPGNQARLRLLAARHGAIQPKLAIGKVDDLLEHEADQVADRVMRMAEPDLSTAAPQISRKCAACEAEEKLQKKSAGPQDMGGAAPDVVDEVLGSPGQPLDTATRGFFEPRFGCDFGGVRVHTDDRAAQSADAVQARAYTVGNHVVFARGQFSPGSNAGRRLLAHEFAHVAQQSGARRRGAGAIARAPFDPTKDVGTVDDAGKVAPGQATTDGTWRIPVQGLGKDGKGRAVVLIPNAVKPSSSGPDKPVPVDVLLHLHGLGVGYDVLQPGKSDFAGVLKPGELRDVDLYQMDQQLLVHAKATKRLIIGVLPQGTAGASFDIGADSDAYLKDVFAKIDPALLPKGAVPGHVTVSGHSGGGPTAMKIAEKRTAAGEHPDVLLFDAINFSCPRKEPDMKDGKPVLDKNNKPVMHCVDCTSNEYPVVSDWVTKRIRADVAVLTASAPADQAAELKKGGTRFRGFTSASIPESNPCGYGHWYGLLHKDIDATIKALKVAPEVDTQLRENYVVKTVPGPHERVLAHGSLEAALKDI